jgi:hypothetical protein
LGALFGPFGILFAAISEGRSCPTAASASIRTPLSARSVNQALRSLVLHSAPTAIRSGRRETSA